MAIDAPLAFPDVFRALLTNPELRPLPAPSHIESRLAFRDCERWINEQFGSPLSASFDKLGNNATLAITAVRELRADGFAARPFDLERSDREVIEVYPRTAKIAKSSEAIAPVAAHLSRSHQVGTDQYDAGICAILGLVFAGRGADLDLPALVGPTLEEVSLSEGWIYALPSVFVSDATRPAS